MTKKFVKADMKFLLKKQDQPAPYPRPPNDNSKQNKNRSLNIYQERSQTTELRKYFQPLPPDASVEDLINKFPTFFTDMILHPQPLRVNKPSNDSYGNNYRQFEKPVIELETIPDWQSQGEIELGAKISQEIVSKVQNVAPINLCELKQYEKEFLEEEMRRKLNEEMNDVPPPKTVQKKEEKVVQAKKFAEDSDQQVEIKKVTITKPTVVQTQHFEPEYVVDDDEDDEKFKESSSGSDDDIFGSGSEKQSKEKEEDKKQNQKIEISHGHIKCAKGEFSMFALSMGINEDQFVWAYSSQNGQKISNLISSKEMDKDYVNTHSVECPFVCFDPTSNNYIPYSVFHTTPDIKFFKTINKTFNYNYNNANSNNFRRKKEFQNKNIDRQRKFSENSDVVEGRTDQTRNRKFSNNYKQKKQQQRM